MKITVTLPDSKITVGDLTAAAGAIFNASAQFVDFDALYEGQPNAVDRVGCLLLDLARQLETAAA